MATTFSLQNRKRVKNLACRVEQLARDKFCEIQSDKYTSKGLCSFQWTWDFLLAPFVHTTGSLEDENKEMVMRLFIGLTCWLTAGF